MKLHYVLILAIAALGLVACGDELDDSKVGDVLEEGKKTAGDTLEKGKKAAGDTLEKGKEAAGEALDKGKEAAGDALDKGKEAAGDALDKSKEAASDLMKSAKERWAALDIPDDVPGIPDLPMLTGDKAKDKAALVKALESLQAAWTSNKAKLADVAKKGITGATDEVKAIKRNNAAYQKVADALQDLLDKVQ